MKVAAMPFYYYRVKGARGLACLAPWLSLLPLVWICGFGGAWMADPKGLLHERPRAFCALLACLFVEAVVSLIFSHLTRTAYRNVRTLSLPLACCWALARFGRFSRRQQEVLLLAYLSVSLAYVAHLLRYIVRECCGALGVECFRIAPKDAK
jgi:hypothetical protein